MEENKLNSIDFNKIRKYHQVILSRKTSAIEKQLYKTAANLREIERTYFGIFNEFPEDTHSWTINIEKKI